VATRLGTMICLVALAAAVLFTAGCGGAARPAATRVAARVASTGHTAVGRRSPSAVPAKTGSAVASAGVMTGCQGPVHFYRFSSSPHGGGALPRCWRVLGTTGSPGDRQRP